MKINPTVNTPTTSTTNFKALTIAKGAKENLKNCNVEILEKLSSAGKKLKYTKHYHLHVNENLDCILKSDNNAYFGPFVSNCFKKIEQGFKDNVLYFDDKLSVARNKYGQNYKFTISSLVGGVFNLKVNHIDDCVKLVKELDSAAIEHNKEILSANEIIENAKKQDLIKNLLDKFAE